MRFDLLRSALGVTETKSAVEEVLDLILEARESSYFGDYHRGETDGAVLRIQPNISDDGVPLETDVEEGTVLIYLSQLPDTSDPSEVARLSTQLASHAAFDLVSSENVS